MKKRNLLIILFLTVTFLISGCGTKEEDIPAMVNTLGLVKLGSKDVDAIYRLAL